MANNRMYLKFGDKRIFLAKYYPSTGWYPSIGLEERMMEAFDLDDFPDEKDRKANLLKPGFGPPYSRYGNVGNIGWEIEYEDSEKEDL